MFERECFLVSTQTPALAVVISGLSVLPCHRICQLWKIRDLEKDGVEWFEPIEIHSCSETFGVALYRVVWVCVSGVLWVFRFPMDFHVRSVEGSKTSKLLPWSKDQYGGLTSVGGMFGRSGQFQLRCRSHAQFIHAWSLPEAYRMPLPADVDEFKIPDFSALGTWI